MVFQPEETFKIRNHEIAATRILGSLSQRKNGLRPPRIRTPTYTTLHLWDVLTIASSSLIYVQVNFAFVQVNSWRIHVFGSGQLRSTFFTYLFHLLEHRPQWPNSIECLLLVMNWCMVPNSSEPVLQTVPCNPIFYSVCLTILFVVKCFKAKCRGLCTSSQQNGIRSGRVSHYW